MGGNVDLGTEVTNLAVCVAIIRPDGVQIGLTAHDRPLMIGGLLHQSSPGLELSAIRSASLGDAQQFEMSGALSPNGVAGADIRAGRYRGATARAALADWTAPNLAPVVLATGSLEQFQFSSDRFTCAVVSSLAKLSATLLPVYTPYCRAQFGDRQCRVAAAGRRRRDVVGSIDRAQRALTLAAVWPTDWAAVGHVRVLSGRCSGAEMRVEAVDNGHVLVDKLPGDLLSGDRVAIESGCDQQLSTCRDVYRNLLNFRGEPNLPGADVLSAYEF